MVLASASGILACDLVRFFYYLMSLFLRTESRYWIVTIFSSGTQNINNSCPPTVKPEETLQFNCFYTIKCGIFFLSADKYFVSWLIYVF